MHSPISIRAATPLDADSMSRFIVGLAHQFILFEFSERGQKRFLSDHTAARMRERLTGNFAYYLAEIGDRLVGLAGVRDGTHLFHLFVAEDLQRQGLGRRLWECAQAECRKQGRGVITVNSSRNAVSAYEKYGFVVAGPEQNVDDVIFVPMKIR